MKGEEEVKYVQVHKQTFYFILPFIGEESSRISGF